MCLDFNRCGRRRPGRKLRIESPDNAIRALGRESRCGVEEPEIARMGHMHDAVLKLGDAPGNELLERSRLMKINPGELLLEGAEIERRDDGSLSDALIDAR